MVTAAYVKLWGQRVGAIDASINMMDSRLVEEDGRAHFMTKRFDRRVW